jgi:hypothetical protein
LLKALLALLLLLGFVAPLAWPLYAATRLVLPRPPITPRPARVGAVMREIATADPPPPGLPWPARLALLLRAARAAALAHLWGLCWQIDELAYGRALAALPLAAPLVEVSAARSGSTQLVRYLEAAPRLRAPPSLFVVFPFLWVWRTCRWLGLPPRWVEEKARAYFPPEYLERHELDPWQADTFEIAYMTHTFGDLSAALGPRVALGAVDIGRPVPEDHGVWGDLALALDGIGRRVLLDAPPGTRLLVKGHFLGIADALAARWPDARFLGVAREPSRRLQSVVNFHRCHPHDALVGPLPWTWARDFALEAELGYCEEEMRFFQGPQRLIVRFEDQVADPDATLARIWTELLGEPPPTAKAVPYLRERHRYAVNRSLAALGVNEAALRDNTSRYEAWRAALP